MRPTCFFVGNGDINNDAWNSGVTSIPFHSDKIAAFCRKSTTQFGSETTEAIQQTDRGINKECWVDAHRVP